MPKPPEILHLDRKKILALSTMPNSENKLFTVINDRQRTMLAYEANYFPASKLGLRHRVVFHRAQQLSKQELLHRCNENFTCMDLFPQDRQYTEKPFAIHWIYGNIPTETEWNRIEPEDQFMVVYRISPLIKDSGGRIALLTLLSKSKLKPVHENETDFGQLGD